MIVLYPLYAPAARNNRNILECKFIPVIFSAFNVPEIIETYWNVNYFFTFSFVSPNA